MSTQMVPVPVGEYPAVIDKVEMKPWQSRDGAKSGMKAELTWLIDDHGVKQLLGREQVQVRQDIMLDLNDSGQLDTGKGRNVTLGRLRDAVGLNLPGQPFSFRMLQGKAAKINVQHRPYNDAIFAEVKGVTRL